MSAWCLLTSIFRTLPSMILPARRILGMSLTQTSAIVVRTIFSISSTVTSNLSVSSWMVCSMLKWCLCLHVSISVFMFHLGCHRANQVRNCDLWKVDWRTFQNTQTLLKLAHCLLPCFRQHDFSLTYSNWTLWPVFLLRSFTVNFAPKNDIAHWLWVPPSHYLFIHSTTFSCGIFLLRFHVFLGRYIFLHNGDFFGEWNFHLQ